VSIQQKSEASLLVGSELFRRGVSAGMHGQDKRFDLTGAYVDELTAVAIVDNLCCLARDGELSTDRLVYDAGILVGYTVSKIER
jgi:hypothetical protein